jgi:asparagine synthase (glutamine-hydrolysing)
MAKLGRVLEAPTVQDAYAALLAHWENPADLVRADGSGRGSAVARPAPWGGAANAGEVTDQLLRSDLAGFLPDDVLTKVDRAAMAVSLEVRAPFLDRRVLQTAWRIPAAMKVHDGTTKWVLRQILDRHVPRSLMARPKMGFGVPIDSWLRGPLRPWAEDLLAVDALNRHALLEPEPIRQAWRRHLDGHRDLGYELWDVLMLQAFMDHWHGGIPAARSQCG